MSWKYQFCSINWKWSQDSLRSKYLRCRYLKHFYLWGIKPVFVILTKRCFLSNYSELLVKQTKKRHYQRYLLGYHIPSPNVCSTGEIIDFYTVPCIIWLLWIKLASYAALGKSTPRVALRCWQAGVGLPNPFAGLLWIYSWEQDWNSFQWQGFPGRNLLCRILSDDFCRFTSLKLQREPYFFEPYFNNSNYGRTQLSYGIHSESHIFLPLLFWNRKRQGITSTSGIHRRFTKDERLVI